MSEQVEKSSVELTRNAKGDTQILVKARHEDVAVAGKAAQEEYDRLCALVRYKDKEPIK